MTRKIVKGLAVLLLGGMSNAHLGYAAEAVTLNGAGSTFGAPIYTKWFDEYHNLHPDIQINYQPIGSGGGIQQVTAKTVDFGATDGPMTDEQLAKAPGKLLHLPTVLGGVVPIYNLESLKIRFTGRLLANIYLDKVSRWNDAEIRKENPGANLPDQAITVVHRSDGSGTSYCFTDYLSKVSPEWKQKVGQATSVNWPVGLGGKGSEGVTGLVKQTPGAIGYVELIYALQNGLDYAPVKNAAGRYLKADLASVQAAAAGAARHMPKDYRVSITNAPGAGSYPISTFTWLLVYERNDGGKGKILKDFLRWMLSQGQAMAAGLGYAPLPGSVKSMERKTIETVR